MVVLIGARDVVFRVKNVFCVHIVLISDTFAVDETYFMGGNLRVSETRSFGAILPLNT